MDILATLESTTRDFASTVLARLGGHGLPSHDLLKKALEHGDARVRERAAACLSRQRDPIELDTVTVLVREMEKNARKIGASAFASPLFDHLDDQAKLEKVLAATSTIRDEELRATLWRAIEGAPLRLLVEQKEAIQKLAKAQVVSLEFLAFREKMAGLSPEQLWAWLTEHVASVETPEDDGELAEMEARAHEVVELLARTPVPSTEQVIQVINDKAFAGTTYECILLDLLGKRPGLAAVGCLFDRWASARLDGDEMISETAIEALADSDEPAAVANAFRLLQVFRPGAANEDIADQIEDLLRLLLVRYRPDAVAALLGLMEGSHATDDFVGDEAALVLASFPVPEALAAARKWAAKINDPAIEQDMSIDMLVNHDLLGLALPGREKWEKRRIAYEREQKALQKEVERRIADNDWDGLGEGEGGEGDEGDDSGEAQETDVIEAVEPFVREAPKVGRNDACPCGSGKKYKKCCLTEAGMS